MIYLTHISKILYLIHFDKYIYNLAKNIERVEIKPEKVSKNSSKIGQDKKILISAFAYFLTAIDKVLFLRRNWTLGYVSTQV